MYEKDLKPDMFARVWVLLCGLQCDESVVAVPARCLWDFLRDVAVDLGRFCGFLLRSEVVVGD